MNRSMPTRPDTVARGPNEPGQATPSEQVAFGRQQWVRKWRVFASQFSQPQLMKLAASVLGEQAIHSSQIHGFSTGKLRDPAPKVLLSIGRLNLAIARSNGSDDAAEGERCPGSLTELWSGKKWLTDEQGKPMGPYEVFGAVTGLIDLGTDIAVDIDPADQAAVSKSLGKFIRTKLMEQGLDFMDSNEMSELNEVCPITEELIFNKEVDAAQLTAYMPELADVCGVHLDQLIDFAVAPITTKAE